MSVQATFCATLVDEWVRGGVRVAVVAPGSRSTPLALALVADGRVDVQVHHDERCAGFMALGVGLATGRPAVALCTSGTAAVHFHAAVVEAHHAGVPLLVATADRPPELRDVGAPQAIDQTHLYGRSVRWFFDPGVPDEAMAGAWRSIAARSVAEAVVGRGPVHLNLPFREPLVGEPGDLPPARDGDAPWRLDPPPAGRWLAPPWRADAAAGPPPGPDTAGPLPGPGIAGPPPSPGVTGLLPGRRGVLLAGRGAGVAADVDRLAAALGWPVLADPRSGYAGPHGVHRADAILRTVDLRPEVVVRLGDPPASKVVNAWAAGAPVELVVGSSADSSRTATALLPGDAATLLAAVEPGDVPAGWLDRWLALDAAAEAAITAELDASVKSEPAVARAVLAGMPSGGHLVVASSMPVRDLEWFATPRADVTVHANRGANGIDGTISTAIGVALATGAPTTVLLGDVAFLHDANALVGLAARGVDLTIVVLDNDGGGIFSFLPQAGVLDPATFERLFGTPHGVDIAALAAAHGLGPDQVVVVRTDRAANVDLHARIHAAVAEALR